MGRLRKDIAFQIMLIIALLFIVFIAIVVGKYTVTIKDFVAVISGESGFDVVRSVIINQRIPRTIMAVLVGVSLSVSGLIYQEIFRNKLVSPDILGVSSGAGIGACFAILIGAVNGVVIGISFVMGIISMLLTVAISRLFDSRLSATLPLAGIVVGGFMSAGISFAKFIAGNETQLGEITFWLLGSFSNAVYSDVVIVAIVVTICMVALGVLSWRINILSLGKDEAQAKGVNYSMNMNIIIILITILTSVSVAYCGIIGWVGLVIPHIARLIFGADVRKTLPITILSGGIFMVLCDVISRSFTYAEIPISAVTGFLGTPLFILVLLIKRRKNCE